MMKYNDDELLMISGIQHYYYCKRQWYLIHVEQQWSENLYTTKGNILHEKVDDPFVVETRKNKFISRSLPLVSYELGFYGVSDAVEFILSENGCYIKSKKNYYLIIPVEYKVGKPKVDDCDKVQLCLQAMCLEEMLDTEINQGCLYYGKTRHRENIELDKELRNSVRNLSKHMHRIIKEGTNIEPEYGQKCDRCSLKNLCVPNIKTTYSSVNRYIKTKLLDKEGLDA